MPAPERRGYIHHAALQERLFEFPLEYSAGGILHRVDIRDKSTRVRLPITGKPADLLPDPNVNVLADFEVSGQ